MSEVDRQIERSRALLERTAPRYRDGALRDRRVREAGRRLTRILIANAVIIAAAIGIGLAAPIGLMGVAAVVALMIAATFVLASLTTEAPPKPEALRATPLKALPAQTERWLAAQRPALPAPAVQLVDQIALRLDALAPQLDRLPEEAPAAADVRKLLGEQLPEFLSGYARVPEPLRRVERNGQTPDAQLVAGLRVIEEELGEMTAQLAQGDLDALATRGRFLEIKYQGDAPTAP